MQEHWTAGSAQFANWAAKGPAASETRRCNARVVWGGRARCHNLEPPSLFGPESCGFQD
jgi:hypothetical protein